MKKVHERIDRTLGVIVAVLVVAGLLIFLSASLGLMTKDAGAFEAAAFSQLALGLCGGVLGAWIVTKIPLKVFRVYSLYIFILALVLTAAVFLPVIGLSVNGATRWLDLGVTTLQPAELLKIGYVLYLATWLAAARERAGDLWSGVVPFAVMTGLVGVLLLLQPDTDTFLVIAGSGIAVMFAAGMRYRHLFAAGAVAVVLLGLLILVRPYLLDRVMTFIEPSRDPLGSGYQIQQSLIAVGSGGIMGRGYGQSIQKFNYLPEASSDSIFAVFAEEFGFVGSVTLVLGFLTFALRGMWVSARAKDMFSALVVVGLVSSIAIQAFLNMAAMLGIAPVGGLPLVFISHGGTALMIALVMVGLVLNVSRGVRT